MPPQGIRNFLSLHCLIYLSPSTFKGAEPLLTQGNSSSARWYHLPEVTRLGPGRAGLFISVFAPRSWWACSEFQWGHPSPTKQPALSHPSSYPSSPVPTTGNPTSHSALLVSPCPQSVPTLTPPFKKFVLALCPSVPSSPSFRVVLWEPVAWKQGRNTLSWKKMSAWYLLHVILHTCPYRPCYEQWAGFISCWLEIRNYYSVSLSLYIDMNVGGNHIISSKL